MPTRHLRADVPLETTWDLSDLFPDEASWAVELQSVAAAREQLDGALGGLSSSAAALLACLQAMDQLQARLMRVSAFAYLRNAQDGTDAGHQAATSRAAALQAQVAATVSGIEAEILAFPEGLLQQLQQQEPGLAPFATLLDDLLALRPYRLGAEAERVLAALGEVLDAPSTVYNRSKAGDLRFTPFVDGQGEQHANSFNGFESRFELHADTTLRRNAWASFTAGLKTVHQTYGATFATETTKNITLARLRGHACTEDFLLQEHKLPRGVYTQVLQIIQAELAPHMRRYARLRQRVLGLDTLLYCDLKSPLDPGFSPQMGWSDACALVQEALAVMGPEYAEYMHTALTRRWVDRADNVGKSSGAFCATPYGVHPYILITWSDTMRNVFTLAHELGHGGHFRLAMQHQRFVNTRPAMPFIEAPSTINEMLLAQHILGRTQDTRMRRSVIQQVLGTYHHNFVTHLLEAELQRQVYARAEAGTPITARLLDDLKGGILAGFWGDTLTLDDGARMTWMRQPHYYMGLYPYTYAVGLVASTAMAQRIAAEGEPAVQRWLQALAAGGTLPPLELLRHAGIDLHTPQPIHDAVAYVGRLIDELEASFA